MFWIKLPQDLPKSEASPMGQSIHTQTQRADSSRTKDLSLGNELCSQVAAVTGNRVRTES